MELTNMNWPALMSVLAIVLAVLVGLTNIFVQVIKQATWDKVPTNVVAVAVAVSLSVLALFAWASIMHTAVVWYMIVGAVVVGIVAAYGAMVGYDKLMETIESWGILRGKRNG